MKKQKNTILKKFLIAGGNSTLLVWDCPESERLKLTKKSLKKVEQVGFIKNNTLTMMGDELCINATLAFASQLQSSGFLYTSGIIQPIFYTNSERKATIQLPTSYKTIDNIVLLSGIGFLYSPKKIPVTKKRLAYYANKYALPAFGIAIFEKDVLTPYVYVKETDSLFKETACGSGSIAVSIITGKKQIKQPTGEIITVNIYKDSLCISAKVTEIPIVDRLFDL